LLELSSGLPRLKKYQVQYNTYLKLAGAFFRIAKASEISVSKT